MFLFVINSMEQNHSRKGDSHSAGQEITRPLWNLMVYHRVQEISKLDPVLYQTVQFTFSNPVS